MKKLILVLVLLLMIGCSEKEKVRMNGVAEMGDLPADMLYIDDLPQIITVSTESDGDIFISYLNTEGEMIVQMYGCPVISVSCGNIEEQGSYVWTFGHENK